MVMSDEIYAYAELPKLTHVSLRIGHPAWAEPNGNCPLCDDDIKRLVNLLEWADARDGDAEEIFGDGAAIKNREKSSRCQT
jgi:hypothetical protein